MATNFIPPIPIGQFKPSSEAIASWLYEVWKYLQENPIPTSEDVSLEATSAAQNYVAVNVPPMIASAIAGLEYSDLVNNTTLPIYRASNDEIDNPDLLEAWAEGCRFALVDDEAFFIMVKNGDTINLLQVLTEAQSTGVISVNGQTGVVVIPDASQSNSGLMAASDKQLLDTIPGAIAFIENGASASRTISAGQYIMRGGDLYRATASIPVGTSFTASNITKIDNGIANELTAIRTYSNADFSTQNASVTLENCTAARIGRVVSVNLYFSTSADISSYTTIAQLPAGTYPPIEMQLALTHYSTGVIYYGIINANGEVRTRKMLPAGNPIIASISYAS